MIRTFLIATCMFAPFLTTGESIRTNMPLTDGELRRKVVGVWTADGLCLHGVMTNTADGRSLSKQWADGTNCNVGLTSFIESAWRIENGIMIERVTKSSNADITAVGRIFRTKIIRVDDDVLVSVPLGIGVTVTNVVRRLK